MLKKLVLVPDKSCFGGILNSAITGEIWVTDRCTKQCEPQCSYSKYDLRITTAKFPNPGYNLVNKVNYPGTNMNISHMRQNYAELVLKFDTLLTEKITLHPKYDLVTATSSVGGLLGLLIGGSLVT